METIAELMSKHASVGEVVWIGVRPKRREKLDLIDRVEVTETGLSGDHNQTGGKRAITLIQWEHIAVIASLLGRDNVDPALLRRNIAVKNINLLALRNQQFRIGTAKLHGTGICAPCSRMEEAFGHGGYTAVRGHGGITAKIISPGHIRIGDALG